MTKWGRARQKPQAELRQVRVKQGLISSTTVPTNAPMPAALLDVGFAPDEIAIFARTKSLIERQVAPVAESLGLKQALLSTDTGATQGALNIGTLHAAKGLEFRAVAIIGCDDGTIPLKPALDAEYEEEAKAIALAREQQLLYVGCTRARERLLITYAHTPSRFLPLQKARTDLESAH